MSGTLTTAMLYGMQTLVVMSVGVMVWIGVQPCLHARGDKALPWWWRALWPWTQAWAVFFAPHCSWRWRMRLKNLLARAGIPDEVGYEHVLALCWVAAILGGVISLLGSCWLLQTSSGGLVVFCMVTVSLIAGCFPLLFLHRSAFFRQRQIERNLPFLFDMMILCLEAGMSMQGALQQAARRGPAGPLREELNTMLAYMRTGVSREAALRLLVERCHSSMVRQWAAALTQAEQVGMSLAPILRAQAQQCHDTRHVRAEHQAMQAPVKMLLPLIVCIFPCTFIVLAFPIAVQWLQYVK